MEKQAWTAEGPYYATNRPGKFKRCRDHELLFYGSYPSGGVPLNEFVSVYYFFGTYYLRHFFSDRTAEGTTYYPFPPECLDDENSASVGDLSAWCGRQEPFHAKIGGGPDAAEYYRSIGRTNLARECWQPDDRIRLLKPLVKTKYVICEGDFIQHFESADGNHEVKIPHDQFLQDSRMGMIPEILYREEFSKE